MFLHALATAVPPATYTQSQCWEIVNNSPVKQRLNRRSQLILRAILNGNSGVETRHFAMPDIEGVFDLSSDQLNATFRAEAPRLAGRALNAALAQAGVVAGEIDALLVCTEWNEFRSPDWERVKKALKGHTIFDGRNIYRPDLVRQLGFTYFGIGKP